MASDPLGADLDDHPLRRTAQASTDSRPAWMGFLGGVAVLVVAITAAIGIWHFAGGPASPLTLHELRETEALLDQLGFPPGPVDGAIDEQSRSAIRDFQLTAGLVVDEEPSVALLDELRAAYAELNGN